MTQAEIARRQAWRSALWSSGLDFGSGALGTLAFWPLSDMPIWPTVQFGVVGGVLLVVLLLWRRAPRAVCLVLLSINFASALVTSLAGMQALMTRGVASELFQSIKISFIVIAILSPSVWLGLAWMGIFAVAPVIEFYLWTAPMQAAAPPGEPWFAVIYAGIGAVLLLYRHRGLRLERTLSDVRAERLTMQRLAHVALALRDLSNTPLQTLTTGVGLLRHKVAAEEKVLASMDRALARLQELGGVLKSFEEPIEWKPHDESFEAVTLIEEIAAELGSSSRR
jgi:hypothetical protein